MTKNRKYLYKDIDRHGNVRWYFNPAGWKKVRIRKDEDTAAFWGEYERLYALWEQGASNPSTSKHVRQGSLAWIFSNYMRSAEFESLAKNTKDTRRRFYTRIERIYGDVDCMSLTPVSLHELYNTFGERKSAACNCIKAIKYAYSWASRPEISLIDNNPVKDYIPRAPRRTVGHIKWAHEDILQFMNHHQRGSNARICLALCFWTGQRISDVRNMGLPCVVEGRIKITQQKTGREVIIPIHPALRQELEPVFNRLVWLQTPQGAPYSAKSISQRFSYWAREAGLVDRAAHGLRKALTTILAESGASEQALMSITGHSSSEELRQYIQEANTTKMVAELFSSPALKIGENK